MTLSVPACEDCRRLTAGKCWRHEATEYASNIQPMISTHWEGCWRAHHPCAIALIERLRGELIDGEAT